MLSRIHTPRIAIAVVSALLFLLMSGCSSNQARQAAFVPDENASSLAEIINQYRAFHQLDSLAESPTLHRVALAHVTDLQRSGVFAGECNLHSWSDQGPWTPCCYSRDHAKSACMLNKPAEFSNGRFNAPGYEIATVHGLGMSPARALRHWLHSDAHHDVLLNRNQWTDVRWKSIGAAISENYAVVWFSEASEEDERQLTDARGTHRPPEARLLK
ncbi:MAG: hypothetical protein WCY08_01860 [Rhodocyclaceae bacterium]